MFKSTLKKIEEKLEAEKKAIEAELEKFAKKDEKLKGDWDTKFPKFNHTSGQFLDDAADEVEAYATLLPIEHSLETRLADITQALEKIKAGTYGRCEKCGKKIPGERLKICPEARFCLRCSQ